MKSATKAFKLSLATLGLSIFGCNSGVDGSQDSRPEQQTFAIDKPVITADVIAGKFTPPQDKLLLFIGQDSDTISDYITAVPEDNIEGITLYTNLKSANPDATLKAVFKPADWQSGELSFSKSLDESPQAALAIGLAFDQCDGSNHGQEIAQGNYDQTIVTLVTYLKSLAPRKVFLRIGYEFDGPWNCYEPQSYKASFQRIHQILEQQQADNIATVWQSATWPDSGGVAKYDHLNPEHLNSWYPGDDVVDWVSYSMFYRDLSQWAYTPADTPAGAQDRLLNFARAHDKPVFIAEAAPQGYRTGQQTKSVIQKNDASPFPAEQIWQAWYRPFFSYIYENRDVIRAVAYINTHWESQGMWQCKPGVNAPEPGCPNGNWGDSRVQANPFILKHWLQEVNDDNVWVQTSNY